MGQTREGHQCNPRTSWSVRNPTNIPVLVPRIFPLIIERPPRVAIEPSSMELRGSQLDA